MGIAVTDDEIVAMSGRVGRRWEGPLPSIDLERPESLLYAAARGIRSLRIRGLVVGENDELADESRDLVRAASGEILAVAFLADSSRPLAPIGPGVAVIRSEQDFVVDVALADGTHDMATVDGAATAWRALRNLLAGAEEQDFPSERVVTAVVPQLDGESAVVVIAGAQGATDFTIESSRTSFDLPEAQRAPRSVVEAATKAESVFSQRAS